jgi:hypothetical protein
VEHVRGKDCWFILFMAGHQKVSIALFSAFLRFYYRRPNLNKVD